MADLNILHSVRRQYSASLAILRQTIDACPESLWLAPEYPNRFWHIAYHALHYTRFYLQPTQADFQPWAPAGFPWLPFNKLELQFYNIRHIQHHTGQLADRLRNAINIGTPWVRPD
jgi:hypothetical protein